MTHPALKGEVSKDKNKMLTQISPRLGRADVMLDSFSSCIPNAAKESSWTPEVSMSKVISQPRMFLHQLKSRIPLKQIECLTNRYCWRQFNKQVDMVNSDMKLVNFTPMLDGNFSDKSLAINFQPVKLKGVHCIFNFPDKMKSILSNCMLEMFQIHFFAPELAQENIAHAKSISLVHGDSINPLDINRTQKLNLLVGRIPPMFENMGTLRQM